MSIDMTIYLSTVSVPKNPAERRVWIPSQLRLLGTSLRRLAAEEGVSPQAMSNALNLSSSHLETVIAAALGLTAQQMFPERFDAAGNRLGWTRTPQRSTRGVRRNVEETTASKAANRAANDTSPSVASIFSTISPMAPFTVAAANCRFEAANPSASFLAASSASDISSSLHGSCVLTTTAIGEVRPGVIATKAAASGHSIPGAEGAFDGIRR